MLIQSVLVQNHNNKGKGTSYTAYIIENINIFRNKIIRK